MTTSPEALLRQRLQQAQDTFAALGEEYLATTVAAADLAIEALRAGGGVFLAGNGGSAADAQHWAAELVGRYLEERAPLNVHALTVNTSTLTALVNDYPPEEVFERQVRAHVRAGDVFVGISTSGNSRNILLAAEAARAQGAKVIGVTGASGGALARLCDVCFCAPSSDTPRIQEAHLHFGHGFCELIEASFVEGS